MADHRRSNDVNLQHALQLKEYEAIADRIAADRPAKVLDWGCGFGYMTILLRERGLEVEAFDFRPEVDEPGRRPLARYPDIEAYIENRDPVTLPYDDDAFDAVLSCGVLEHVSDPDGSLEEVKRVLRPGGTFYVYKLPNRWSYLEAIARVGGLYYHGAWEHDRVYDVASAATLLGRHGFAVRELRRANMLPLTVGGNAIGRAADALWRLNRALSRVPGLAGAATNVELIATAPAAGATRSA